MRYTRLLCAAALATGVVIPVPAAAAAAASSSELRNEAATIASAYASEAASIEGYAGVRVTGSGRVVVSVVGAAAEFRQHAERLAFQNRIDFESASRSMRDMEVVRDQIARDADALAAAGVIVTSWGPDVVTNTVRVAVTADAPHAFAVLRARYGDSVRTELGGAPMDIASRLYDSSPWNGGDFIALDNGSDCTSGPPVYRPSTGATYLLTAGHCYLSSTTAGLSGYTYRTFQGSHAMGTGSSPFMGWTAAEKVNGGYDDALIATSASKYDWRTATATQTSGAVAQVSAQGSVVGASVCASGAFSGERCGAIVQYVNQDTRSFNGVVKINMVAAENPGVPLAGPGDSGAPVYQVHASGLVVTGLLTSIGDDSQVLTTDLYLCPQNDQGARGIRCSDVIWYHDLPSVLNHLGVALKTT